MTLSSTAIKAAKPQDKLTDEKGMYLLIKPNGSKYFRLNYRIHGKRKTLAIGIYPDIAKTSQGKKRLSQAKNCRRYRPISQEKN